MSKPRKSQMDTGSDLDKAYYQHNDRPASQLQEGDLTIINGQLLPVTKIERRRKSVVVGGREIPTDHPHRFQSLTIFRPRKMFRTLGRS